MTLRHETSVRRARRGAAASSVRLVLGGVLAVALGACTAPAPRQQIVPRPAPPTLQSTPFAPPAAHVDAQFEAALALMKNQQPDEAQAAFEALALAHPQLSGALTNLGILYAQVHRRDEAVASFARAVAANPANAVALNWLGVLQRERGDYLAAERAYRQALSVQPDYAAARLNLGILYDVYLKRPHDAIDAYRGYRESGGKAAIVAAWIRELEGQVGVQTAAREGGSP